MAARSGRLVHAIYLVQAAAVLYVVFLAVLVKWLRPGVLGMGFSLVRPHAPSAHFPGPGAARSDSSGARACGRHAPNPEPMIR